uniref:tRNA (guanine(10)-N2)-methyltransferase homolog n=1 Tax=Myxine glutinosa TaxID=7769 RepID=UPI00358F63C4
MPGRGASGRVLAGARRLCTSSGNRYSPPYLTPQELKALFSVFGADLEYDKITSPEKEPFLVVKNVDEETVRKVMARTVCAKSAYEIWGTGRTLDELVTSLQTYPKHRMSPFCKADSTFKISVHSFNKTLPQADRLNKIEALSFLPWDGKVNLSAPDHTFCLLENYAGDVNNIPNDPCQVFFGRWLTDGQRDLIRRYSIKTRHFIGNTSMDATLSFIMANHARVKPQDVVFDPFVGTGSLLVASAHYGAYVTGGDIDYNTIHGIGKASRRNQVWRGPDESIKSNLCQYGLQDRYLDVFVGDASRPPWREGPLFNAIITDPPYGVREATRRTRPRKGRMPDAPNVRFPECSAYHLRDIFTDLLDFAVEQLEIGGRLVYWIPVYIPEYSEDIIPKHPCLSLISNCQQKLTSNTARCLITMEKVKGFEERCHLPRQLDAECDPYKRHNAFREKYFSGVTARSKFNEGKGSGENT